MIKKKKNPKENTDRCDHRNSQKMAFGLAQLQVLIGHLCVLLVPFTGLRRQWVHVRENMKSKKKKEKKKEEAQTGYNVTPLL